MAAIDLTHIIFRAHNTGDVEDDKSVPNPNNGTSGISLAGIKWRAKNIGDVENDD